MGVYSKVKPDDLELFTSPEEVLMLCEDGKVAASAGLLVVDGVLRSRDSNVPPA